VSAGNSGGVVWLKPASGNSVTLASNLNFEGTIIIEGDLVIEGANITLTAQEGFPAIITTGRVLIAPGCQVQINGLVVSFAGLMTTDGYADGSQTAINGGLISDWTGYESSLGGTHVLTYEADRCMLYDFSQGGQGGSGDTEVVDYR
jgi:hypothetical protein